MTHNEKVLALLSDGEPHSHHEIYGLFVIGHSRIADLRKRGHVIESWRDGDDYFYKLCSQEPFSSPSSSDGERATQHGADVETSPSASCEQLSLVDAWREALAPTSAEVIPFPGYSVRVA